MTETRLGRSKTSSKGDCTCISTSAAVSFSAQLAAPRASFPTSWRRLRCRSASSIEIRSMATPQGQSPSPCRTPRNAADVSFHFPELAYAVASVDHRRHIRSDIMAKGMDKRKRDEKKPKKEKPKTNASAPSTKDVVSKAVAKQNQ